MQHLIIPPKMVHKDLMADVLLHRARPALPLQLDKATAHRWTQAGLDFLLALYRPNDENNSHLHLALSNHSLGLTSLFNRSIPADPAWERCRALPYQIIEVEFSASHADVLHKLENLSINDMTDHCIAELFRSTSYTMINQADHYFFYGKDHEHVPGIMLIEAQRQAVYAHVYTMTKQVRGDVTISLDKLDSTFYAYVDLMYPVELVVDDMQVELQPHPKKITYRVSFFQQGKLVAIIDTVANIIEINQFKRLRNLFIYEKSNHSYAPTHPDKVHCTLIASDNREYQVECVSISRLKCVTTSNNMITDDIHTIKININGFTLLSSVELKNCSEKHIVWRFPQLNQDQLINLGEIIKRRFKLINDEVY